MNVTRLFTCLLPSLALYPVYAQTSYSNGPGVLLALKLYKATKDKHYLDTALVLYDWTNNTGTMLQANVILYTITRESRYLQEAQRQAAVSLKEFFRRTTGPPAEGRFPDNYWFNAVLMRGCQDLYQLDKDKTCLQAFITDADGIWKTEMNVQGLAGPRPAKKLLDQAGLLEICARIAQLQKNGYF